jgi:purine-binding chemotaxis protein CheW
MGEAQQQVLVWAWKEQRYGLPIEQVERTVQMVEVSRIPQPPEHMLGVIDVQGTLTPVMALDTESSNTWRPEINQQLVLARAPGGPVAIPAEEIVGLVDAHTKNVTTTPSAQFDYPLKYLQSVLKTSEGLVMIPDLAALLGSAKQGLENHTQPSSG